MTEYELPQDRLARWKQEEDDRVADLIKRDRKDRIRENDRKAAELEVADGRFVNLAETVVEPTPEWLEKGDVGTFVPKQPKGTTKVIRTVKRIKAAMVMRLYFQGKITEDHMRACMWYRDQHEIAGLMGRVKSNHLSLTGNTGGGGGLGQAPMALHAREAEARELFRAARAALSDGYIKFFDSIVIHDIPPSRAARFARCRNERAFVHFRALAQALAGHVEKVPAFIAFTDRNDDD